jgi:hypothetical protein
VTVRVKINEENIVILSSQLSGEVDCDR